MRDTWIATTEVEIRITPASSESWKSLKYLWESQILLNFKSCVYRVLRVAPQNLGLFVYLRKANEIETGVYATKIDLPPLFTGMWPYRNHGSRTVFMADGCRFSEPCRTCGTHHYTRCPLDFDLDL